MDFVAIPALVVLLYLVGEVLKYTILKSDEHRKLLPIVCAIIGAVASGVLFVVAPQLIPVCNDILTAVVMGAVSGLTATGSNQVYKQLKSYMAGNSDTTTTE